MKCNMANAGRQTNPELMKQSATIREKPSNLKPVKAYPAMPTVDAVEKGFEIV